MSAQLKLEFREEGGRESAFTQLERWIETLAEPAQLLLFRAGERRVFNVGLTLGQRERRAKDLT